MPPIRSRSRYRLTTVPNRAYHSTLATPPWPLHLRPDRVGRHFPVVNSMVILVDVAPGTSGTLKVAPTEPTLKQCSKGFWEPPRDERS